MRKILVTLLFLLFGTSAFADCNIKSGSINILANDFPALRTFVETSKQCKGCLLYTSPSPRDVEESRMPSSA